MKSLSIFNFNKGIISLSFMILFPLLVSGQSKNKTQSEAEKLVTKHACLMCHNPTLKAAPDLKDVFKKYKSSEGLRKMLKKPPTNKTYMAQMPPVELTKKEAKLIYDFLKKELKKK